MSARYSKEARTMSDKTRDGHLPHNSAPISTPISRGALVRGAAGLGAGPAGVGLVPAGVLHSGSAFAAPFRANPVTIEVWYPYSGTTVQNFLKVLNEFQSSHPN